MENRLNLKKQQKVNFKHGGIVVNTKLVVYLITNTPLIIFAVLEHKRRCLNFYFSGGFLQNFSFNQKVSVNIGHQRCCLGFLRVHPNVVTKGGETSFSFFTF